MNDHDPQFGEQSYWRDGMSIRQYHDGPEYSSSQLKRLINVSPLAFWDEFVNSDAQSAVDFAKWGNTNRTQIIGGAVAAIMDDPRVFEDNYAVLSTEIARLPKNGDTFRSAFRHLTEQDPHRTVILPVEVDQARAIVDAIAHHPDPETRGELDRIFNSPGLVSERSFFHIDEETRLRVKTRPDLVLDLVLPIDIKSTADIRERVFSEQITRFGHHIQAAMGLDIINKVQHSLITNWLLIAVEQKPPHDVGVYYLDPKTLALGHEKYREALRKLRHCLDTDHWPGKVSGIQPISAPSWAFTDD